MQAGKQFCYFNYRIALNLYIATIACCSYQENINEVKDASLAHAMGKGCLSSAMGRCKVQTPLLSPIPSSTTSTPFNLGTKRDQMVQYNEITSCSFYYTINIQHNTKPQTPQLGTHLLGSNLTATLKTVPVSHMVRPTITPNTYQL